MSACVRSFVCVCVDSCVSKSLWQSCNLSLNSLCLNHKHNTRGGAEERGWGLFVCVDVAAVC